MISEIAFVMSGFPEISETFVVNQIIAALHRGYRVTILPTEVLPLAQSSQAELIGHHQLLAKTYPAPTYHGALGKDLVAALHLAKTLRRVHYPAFCRALNPVLFGRAALNLTVFFQLARFAEHCNFNLYHAQFGPNGIALANAKKAGLLRGKILTTFHGYDAFYTPATLTRLRKYYKNLFAVGDYFTANTTFLADQLRALGCPPEKIELLPMGVDTELFCPDAAKKKADGTLRLLSVGRLIKWKGHNLGIRVVKQLVEAGWPVRYTIIGDGPERARLQQLVHELELASQVTLPGALGQLAIRDHLQASDLFLMTSIHDESGRRETQGVVSAEAQACGLPVVGFRSGGVPYTLEEGVTGLLAAEADVQDYFQAVSTLLADPDKRRAMALNARKFIEHNFSLAGSCERLLKIYAKIVN